MKKILAVFILAACGVPATAASADLTPDDFQYCADVRGAVKADSLYQIHLGDEIIQKAAPVFEDILLFDPSRKETPSVMIENSPPAGTVETYPLEITGYGDGASTSVITMKLPEKHLPISVLNLETADTDFKKRVSLSGSSDGKAWRPLAEDTIYDFSSQVDLRKTKIEFAKSDYRFFRLKLTKLKPASEAQPSIRLKYEGLDFSANGVREKELRIRSVEGSTAAPKEKASVYDGKTFKNPSLTLDKDGDTVIILRADLPIDKLSFEVSNPFYYRMANLYASDTGKEDSYQLTASQAVYRFPLSAEERETRNYLEPHIPKHGYYKIVILNKNNPPLEVKGIALSWIRKNLYFIALRNGGPYSLCFGNASLTRPDYDISHFVNRNTLQQHAYEKLEITRVRENAGFTPPVPGGRKAQVEKMILRIVVIVLVVGMGLWLYTLMKKVSQKK